MEVDKTRSHLPRQGARGERVYLMVFEGESLRSVPLPEDGEVFIGRAPECEVRLADEGVSRRHAQLTLRGGSVWVSDLDSHNGTRVNGQPAGKEVALAAGDTLSICDASLVVHCGSRAALAKPLQAFKAFRERLDAELERSLRSERPFAVALLRFAKRPAPSAATAVEDAVASAVRLMDVAAWSEDSLLLLLPEREPAEAPAAVDAVAEALSRFDMGLRVGFATFPADGADSDTLLLAARQAAEAAGSGSLESADHCVRQLAMGDNRVVLVADPAMVRVYELIERLAKAALPVLVLGETGSGKENAAYAVHHFSTRSKGPFISVNCGALPETLAESELFGYEKGAFTGAAGAKAGLFEAASGGTIFLDEVGELSLATQVRLLRVLESKTLLRLGSVKEKSVDIRVVAATKQDLPALVKSQKFREDLYFRLGAATVMLPPLRERPREISVLARRFVELAAGAAGRAAPTLSARTMALLAESKWDGNVRELKNAMEFAVATAVEPVIEPWHLPPTVAGRPPAPPKPVEAPASAGPSGFRPLAEEIRELERRRIKEALEAAGGVQTRAAELIGMPRRTFVLRLRELRLGEGEKS